VDKSEKLYTIYKCEYYLNDLTTEMSSQSTAVVAAAAAKKGKTQDFPREAYVEANEGELYDVLEKTANMIKVNIYNSIATGARSPYNCFSISTGLEFDEASPFYRLNEFFEENKDLMPKKRTVGENRFMFFRFCLVMVGFNTQDLATGTKEFFGSMLQEFKGKNPEIYYLRETSLYSAARYWKSSNPGTLARVRKQINEMMEASIYLQPFSEFYIHLSVVKKGRYIGYLCGRAQTDAGGKEAMIYSFLKTENTGHGSLSNPNLLKFFIADSTERTVVGPNGVVAKSTRSSHNKFEYAYDEFIFSDFRDAAIDAIALNRTTRELIDLNNVLSVYASYESVHYKKSLTFKTDNLPDASAAIENYSEDSAEQMEDIRQGMIESPDSGEIEKRPVAPVVHNGTTYYSDPRSGRSAWYTGDI